MGRPSRRRVRRVGRHLAFASLPLALLLGLAEGLARLVPPPLVSPGPMAVLLSAHPTRIWGLTPGTFHEAGVPVTIGEDGLRQTARSEARQRVLTLGDSSIYGYGLTDDQTLHASLGRALTASGVDADVICAAVPGYSTEQTLVLLEELGWDLAPDVLVVGNLWSDANIDHFQDRTWLEALAAGPAQVERGLARSAAWRWIRRWRTPAEAWYLPVGWIRDPMRRGDHRVPVADYAANLETLIQAGRERGAQAILLQPTNRIRMADLVRADPSVHGWAPWFSAQRDVAARLGVPLVDARDVVQATGLAGDEAFLDDMHPTGAVNAALGARLAQVISERGWLESGEPRTPGSAPSAPPDPHSTGGSLP